MSTPVTVKFFLDCLHLIPSGPVDIATIIEVIDFCQFEGKTTFDSFELDLLQGLLKSVMETTLPFGTELLISAYFTKVDNLSDDRYQQKVTAKATKEAVSSLFYEFDSDNSLNKRLIEMCVKKGMFVDESKESVLIRLMMYGKELEEFQAENSEPTEAGIENLEIEDDFRPDAHSVRYSNSLIFCLLKF